MNRYSFVIWLMLVLFHDIESAQAKENSSQELPISAFTQLSQFKNLQLSPDGKHIAITVPKADTTNLVIVERQAMMPVLVLGFGTNKHIGKFYWANNERLIYTKTYKRSGRDKHVYQGEIFAANVNGTNKVQIFGHSDTKSNNRNKKGLKAHGRIIHMLPEDPDHVMLEADKWGNDFDDPTKIYRVNIYNKKRTLISTLPHGNMRVLLDRKGNIRFASAKNRQGKKLKYQFIDQKWVALGNDHPLKKYSFVSISEDNQTLYVRKPTGKNLTDGLYKYDLATQKLTLIFNHPTLDIHAYIREPGSRLIIGAKTMQEQVNFHYFDENSPFTKLHQQLVATFPAYDLKVGGHGYDSKVMVIGISNDKNSGEFYLFDREKQSLEYLLSRRSWLPESQMMPRKFIEFTARDGQPIYGYLTLPKANDRPHPLVVDVHGGPYGVQDKWHFNTDAQLFASRGYAVLQINFRGSGGYGKTYEKSAYLKRNSLIQHDIIDGTKWAQSLANIDDNKVCIIGGSFGGYSALMASLIEPELYRCAIPRYGPYDLVFQMQNADYMDKDSVAVGAKEKYGDNEKIWREHSPLTYIDKLKTPLMIVTGGKDTRVPPESAWHLKAELDKRDIDYQWLYKASEGHGFINPENKQELYQKTLEFLDNHLKHSLQ